MKLLNNMHTCMGTQQGTRVSLASPAYVESTAILIPSSTRCSYAVQVHNGMTITRDTTPKQIQQWYRDFHGSLAYHTAFRVLLSILGVTNSEQSIQFTLLTSISETAPRMRSWRDCEVEDSEAEDRQWAVLKLLRLPFVCQTRLASSSTFRCCRRWFHKDHFRIRSSHCNQYRCEPRRSQAAWGITSKENYEHWTWFLSNLPDSLPNFNTQRTVTMSDRQKGLNKAIKGTLYMVTEVYCCKHIERNLVETYGMKIKSVFWTLMYARTNMPSWQVWLLSES